MELDNSLENAVSYITSRIVQSSSIEAKFGFSNFSLTTSFNVDSGRSFNFMAMQGLKIYTGFDGENNSRCKFHPERFFSRSNPI